MDVQNLVIVDGTVQDLGVLGPAGDLLLVVVDLRVEQHPAVDGIKLFLFFVINACMK
jgi:hypothetical protein